MFSVMMLGWAIAPASRWSRVKATGALSVPSRTMRLTSSASSVRSPWPSQAMRAGSPSNGTSSRASRIQLDTMKLSGKRRSRKSSILRMSSGSFDSAIQRNGPMARANSGRRKASVKTGISKARSTPPCLAWVRMRLPLSNTTAPRSLKPSIAVTWRTIDARLASISRGMSVRRNAATCSSVWPAGM
ncbi:hypothetical protein D9M68_677970 [compost metagenome]